MYTRRIKGLGGLGGRGVREREERGEDDMVGGCFRALWGVFVV